MTQNIPTGANPVVLPPFRAWLASNIPAVYDNTMSYYDELTSLIKYLESVVLPAVNENSQSVTELANLYKDLKEFVDNYFENLDVQEEINNKLDAMVEDGTFDTIINKTLFNELNDEIDKLNQFVTIEEFKEESDIDDTNAFNLAIADGRPIYLLNKTYSVSSTITINSQTKIYGKSMTNSIITATHDDFVFSYITDVETSNYNVKTNIVLSNFKANCKNFIKFNEHNLEEANWTKQGSLLHIELSNLWINGSYTDATDNNKNTNTIPTINDMLLYGCGIEGNSLFDSTIKNCNIDGFGCGIYFKGCDINTISENRFHNNGIQIYLERVSTYGSQNKISHNDILSNLRYGAITVQQTKFDTIEDNYFECYTASGCAVRATNETGLSIINNRFDNPSVNNIHLLELAPINDDKIVNNRMNPHSSYVTYCFISPENTANGNTRKTYTLAYFSNNQAGILLNNCPFVKTDEENPNKVSPYYIDYANVRLGGALYASPWAEIEESDSLYHFVDGTSSSSVLKITFNNRLKLYAKPLTVRIKYRSTTNTNQRVKITADSNVVHNQDVTIDNDGYTHVVDVDLTSPATLYDTIVVELPAKADVLIYSVELI